MKISTYIRTVVRLDLPEQWETLTTDKKFAFRVEMVEVLLSDSAEPTIATLRGRGIKRDGTTAAIRREKTVTFNALPEFIQKAIR